MLCCWGSYLTLPACAERLYRVHVFCGDQLNGVGAAVLGPLMDGMVRSVVGSTLETDVCDSCSDHSLGAVCGCVCVAMCMRCAQIVGRRVLGSLVRLTALRAWNTLVAQESGQECAAAMPMAERAARIAALATTHRCLQGPADLLSSLATSSFASGMDGVDAVAA